jgi:hypothetical protein
MKRSLKALLMAVVAATALIGPAAAPARAQTANCAGIWYDEYGEDHFVLWPCDSCPSIAGLGDGRFWVVVCFIT